MFKKITAALPLLIILTACGGGSSSSQPNLGNDYLTAPTGSYHVGYRDMRMVNDQVCPDPYFLKGTNEADFGADNHAKFCREFMVRIYYPSHMTPTTSPYFSPIVDGLAAFFQNAGIPDLTADDITAIKGVQSFTSKNLKVSAEKFPVIFFNPGYGMEAQIYEDSITDLVSHGYIVVALSNTFIGENTQFPDGRLVQQTAPKEQPIFDTSKGDILFSYAQITKVKAGAPSDPLFNAMDLEKTGLYGHSMGAIDTINVARGSSNPFKAVATLDSFPIDVNTMSYSPDELKGLTIPSLRINAADWNQQFNIPSDAKYQLLHDNYAVILSPSASDSTYTRHNNFSDYSTLQYLSAFQKIFESQSPETYSLGVANGYHVVKLTNAYLNGFFDKYLKNKGTSFLDKCQAVSVDSAASGSDNMLECGS
ncbi:alpha/beta hydrolase [Burkholderia sp. PAMC 28687]|jgi:pimeloyl-ACP methyl ester carboxylesterase|uniref:alpha/beta hydrolase n=1 Tax=Burkholderia sp. PAMC 28687 TaxID=1795874 RepID=UPI0009E6C9A7|nr:hypothetical protein [Burkholderia sp. PAMC 28687]